MYDYNVQCYVCFSECAQHCSLCYNETECYECTQGYFLTFSGECECKYSFQSILFGNCL